MDIPVIFRYLKDLAANNNRDWFNAHRDAYESAHREFENLLTAVIAHISTFDETIRDIEAKDCTFRIYRDTRFSQDKTPYKIHMGGLRFLLSPKWRRLRFLPSKLPNQAVRRRR